MPKREPWIGPLLARGAALGLSVGWASGMLGAPPVAHAEHDCVWQDRGTTRSLVADCETDETLWVPDGVTLDGRGHRIRAVDPVDGSFAGAVVQNAGASAHVRGLTIEAVNLAPVCHTVSPVDARLRAILLQDADGSLLDNRIMINQGASGCQEGSAIEVRSPTRTVEVLISGNRVEHFQKTGIVLIGAINAGIYFNRVQGEGPVDYIAQNGIQLSGDVSGSVKFNHVSKVDYTGSTASATGILLSNVVDPVEIALNHVRETGVGVRLSQSSEASVRGNTISHSSYDGVAIDGLSGAAQNNQVVANVIAHSGSVGVDLFGAGARHNLVKLNLIVDSGLANVQQVLDAGDNQVLLNSTPRDRGVEPSED